MVAPTSIKATSIINPDMVRKTLSILFRPGEVVELRALNAITTGSTWKRYTASGYFTDHEALISAACTIQRASGVYVTLNPCRRGLITRANNRLRSADDMRVDERTTKDNEIICHRWLPIDIDPVRMDCNDSSSDSEHQAALDFAYYIREHLIDELGQPTIVADSGNGAHLLYDVSLGMTPADTALIQRWLVGFANRFKSATVKLDTSVFNPARIWKLYGSKACKGDNHPEWPHRFSKILEVHV